MTRLTVTWLTAAFLGLIAPGIAATPINMRGFARLFDNGVDTGINGVFAATNVAVRSTSTKVNCRQPPPRDLASQAEGGVHVFPGV